MGFIDASALQDAPAAPAGKFLTEDQLDQGPSTLSALGRGALQGATLGFSDEIGGAIGSLFGDKTYEQERDAIRANNAAAKEAHPWAYGGGEVGGGLATALVPGLGAAGGLAKVAASGALAGGLGAVGTSDASDAGTLAKEGLEGAAVGGVGGALLHGITSKVASLVRGAPQAVDEAAVKALSQGEGKAGASWATTRKMVQDPNVREVIHAPVDLEGKTTTIADLAREPPQAAREAVKAQQSKYGEGLDAIYDKADKASGGVKVSDILKHYDAQIAEMRQTPGNQAFVRALEDAKLDVLDTWGRRASGFEGHPEDAISLKDALAAEGSNVPSTREALIKQYDSLVPSRDVRKFATTLQDRGATNVADPKLGSQVKQFLGSTTRDFVNGHVEGVLGPQEAGALRDLNGKMRALYTIDNVLGQRVDKEAAGRMNASGVLQKALGHGGMIGAGLMAAHGNIPGAIGSLLLPKVLEHGIPAVESAGRGGLLLLNKLVSAAEAGNPWAKAQLAALRATPQGAARLAAINAPGFANAAMEGAQ